MRAGFARVGGVGSEVLISFFVVYRFGTVGEGVWFGSKGRGRGFILVSRFFDLGFCFL